MKKSQEILKVRELDIPIYGGKVTVILFLNTWDKVIKHLRKKGFDTKEYENWDNILGLQFSQYINGSKKFVVIIENTDNIGDTIVHELFHLTQDILEYRGVNFIREDPNEAYAYLIGYLYGQVEKILK